MWEKGYLAEGLFKLNVLATNAINKINKASVYIVESCDIWHARLGHVNFRCLDRMINLGLLPNFKIDHNNKCEICTESKFARQSYKYVFGRSNELLGLIHSNLCDIK